MPALTEKEVNLVSELIHVIHEDLLTSDDWSRVHPLLERLIPADCIATIFYDSHTGVPERQILHGKDPGIFPAYRERYHNEEYATRMALSKRLHVWRMEDIITKERWHQSPAYRELMVPNQLREVLAMALWEPGEFCIRVYLARFEGGKPFSRREVQLLSLIHPHAHATLKKAHYLRQMRATRDSLQAGLDQFDRPIFVFDDSLQLLYLNNRAKDITAADGHEDRLSVIRDAAAQAIEQARSLPEGEPPKGIKCNLGDHLFLVEASQVKVPDGPDHWIVVAVDLTDHLRASLRLAMVTLGLSSREQEICMMLVAGLTNSEIAEKLFISEFTVKDHVKNIFEKIGVANRSEVAAALLGL